MSSNIATVSGEQLVFEQIEAAVKETSRGRWFLEEYARRHRHSDTLAVVSAIEALARKISDRPAPQSGNIDYSDILEMAKAIARTERDIRAQRSQGQDTRAVSASDELDAVVATTEKATEAILSAAERIQEHAWTIRENNGDEAQCDLLDSCATDIYAACAFQDLTSQRIRKVVDTLRFVDQRIKGILEAAGLTLEIEASPESDSKGPGPEGEHAPSQIWMSEAHQQEIDETFEFFTPAEVSEPTMIGADLLDLDSELLSPPAAKPRGKRPRQAAPDKKSKPSEQAFAEPSQDSAYIAPEAYDNQPLEIRLRAFR